MVGRLASVAGLKEDMAETMAQKLKVLDKVTSLSGQRLKPAYSPVLELLMTVFDGGRLGRRVTCLSVGYCVIL